MKKILKLLIILFVSALASCKKPLICNNAYQICEGLDSIKTITTVGFTQDDLDSVIIYKYSAFTFFTNLLDTSRLIFDSYNKCKLVKFNIDGSAAYIIDNISLSRKDTITNVRYVENICERCGEKSFTYFQVYDYRLNRLLKTDVINGITLTK